jgi:hypothetical protein
MLTSSFYHPVSGSYRNNSYFNPAVFEIDIPEYGKIRDVKVWVELVHDHRAGTGPVAATASDPNWFGGSGSVATDLRTGLQGLQIALRSPNMNFENSHPLWNDARVSTFGKNIDLAIPDKYRKVPELLRSSYLLWAGHSVENDLGVTLGGLTSSVGDNEFSHEHPISGYEFDMAVDVDGVPHLGYLGISGPAYARRDRVSGWISQNLEPTLNGGYRTSIDIDRNRIPHLVYYDLANNRIRYATSGSSWAVNTVDAGESDPTIKIDSITTKPVVLYTSGSDVKLARSGSTGWTKETLDHINSTGIVLTDMVIRDGVIHAALLTDSKVLYGKSGSDGWHVETVYDSTPQHSLVTGQTLSLVANDHARVSLALDSHGNPSVFYSTVGNDNFPEEMGRSGVNYATSGSNGWNSELVCAGASDPKGIVDANDVPHVVFGNPGSFLETVNVYYARKKKSWSVQTLQKHSVVLPTIGLGTRNDVKITYTSASDFIVGEAHHLSSSYDVKSQSYFEFDTDIDMRTVFSDSSRIPNPRNLSLLYGSAKDDDPGVSEFPTELVYKSLYASPQSGALAYSNVDNPVRDQIHWLTGSNVPWMSDRRLPQGRFGGLLFASDVAPPEWSGSFGTTIGAADIQPVYPLLEDIFVQKAYDEPLSGSLLDSTSPKGLGQFHLPANRSKIIGYRPGLRGSEVHGKWQLLIGNTADFDGSVGMTGSVRGGFWFRQFRLEFILDQKYGITEPFPSRSRKFDKSYYVPQRPGKRRIGILSGSSAWDIGVNYVYANQPEEYGRSVGITDHTGSANDSFSVYTKLSDSAMESLESSSDYLNNEFGTPLVPLVLGSASFIPESQHTHQITAAILNPKTLIPPANNLKSILARSGYIKTTRDRISEIVSELSGS